MTPSDQKAFQTLPQTHDRREEWNITKVDALVAWYETHHETIRQALSTALTRKGEDFIGIAKGKLHDDFCANPMLATLSHLETIGWAVDKIAEYGIAPALTPRPAQDGFEKFVEMLDREPQHKPRLVALLKEHAAQTQDSGRNEGMLTCISDLAQYIEMEGMVEQDNVTELLAKHKDLIDRAYAQEIAKIDNTDLEKALADAPRVTKPVKGGE